jgi:hypothetical protein
VRLASRQAALVFAGFLDRDRRRDHDDGEVLSRAPTGPHWVARVLLDQPALDVLVMKDLRAFPELSIGIAPRIWRNECEWSAVVSATEAPFDPPQS